MKITNNSHVSAEGFDLEQAARAVVKIQAFVRTSQTEAHCAWVGTGTVIESTGYILTNCHVAAPQLMGEAVPEYVLVIALNTSASTQPKPSFMAQIVTYSLELDLALIKIVCDLQQKPISNLLLDAIPIADSDAVQLGDSLAVLGYPNIGGDTITYTSGNVSGFNPQRGLATDRAWIKTDATIAGGNSGGAALNKFGQLVGVPTIATASYDTPPADIRPLTEDGQIVGPVGGFINGIRPTNLAAPLLEEAGLRLPFATPTPVPVPMPKVEKVPARQAAWQGVSTQAQVTTTVKNLQLATTAGQATVTFDFNSLRNGMKYAVYWFLNGNLIHKETDRWKNGRQGQVTLQANLPANRTGHLGVSIEFTTGNSASTSITL